MTKVAQLGGFLFGPPMLPKVTSLLANQIIISFVKESKNTGNKKLNNGILIDTGLNIIDKKIKEGI